jgi:hypothetical protein
MAVRLDGEFVGCEPDRSLLRTVSLLVQSRRALPSSARVLVRAAGKKAARPCQCGAAVLLDVLAMIVLVLVTSQVQSSVRVCD